MYKIIMIKGKSNMVMDLAFFCLDLVVPIKKFVISIMYQKVKSLASRTPISQSNMLMEHVNHVDSTAH